MCHLSSGSESEEHLSCLSMSRFMLTLNASFSLSACRNTFLYKEEKGFTSNSNAFKVSVRQVKANMHRH